MTSHSELTSYKAALVAEEVSINLSAPIAILELLAERDTTSVSAILWSLKDVLEEQQEKLDELTGDLMHTYRKQMGIK
jgi:hypothetical protein